ncbi:hypothetical protein CHCC20335_4722 [Bacillus paralicheniformis]|nr:hypothetical protein CHCC20335_4722 [Bacillus paralicheniformis]
MTTHRTKTDIILLLFMLDNAFIAIGTLSFISFLRTLVFQTNELNEYFYNSGTPHQYIPFPDFRQ